MDEMIFVTVPKSVLEELMKSIEQIKSDVEQIKNEKICDELLTSEDTRKMLGVCTKTLQEYRDEKILPFSQVGRKIFYKRSDINAFIEKHSIKS